MEDIDDSRPAVCNHLGLLGYFNPDSTRQFSQSSDYYKLAGSLLIFWVLGYFFHISSMTETVALNNLRSLYFV